MVELTPEKKQELDQFITAWSNKGEEVADKVTYWNATKKSAPKDD